MISEVASLNFKYMYTIHDVFAGGFLQLIESITPTGPPIEIKGRERAHAGATKTLANAAPLGPL